MAPPAQKITPAKELTPEEIMSFIIPPPPGLGDDDIKIIQTEPIVPTTTTTTTKVNKNSIPNGFPKFEKCFPTKQESLYSNGGIMESPTKKSSSQNHVIEYPTIERKSAFSCCSKTKKEENLLELPPKLNNKELQPPERPPKSQELHNKISTLPRNGRNQQSIMVSLHSFFCEQKVFKKKYSRDNNNNNSSKLNKIVFMNYYRQHFHQGMKKIYIYRQKNHHFHQFH